MDPEAGGMANGMDFTLPGVSIPESDVRTDVHHPYPAFPYASHGSEYASFTPKPALLPDSDLAFTSIDDGSNFMTASGDADFSMGDDEFAAALANYQPCDDCTPSTKTVIPHHHHPSGRLAGASATLAGHFCCSWLVQGQPCFLCFESAQALDNHIKNDHAGKDGTYRCLWQDCSKHDPSTSLSGPINFGNKPKLMRHVHSHTGFKPFPCPFPDCDKGFVTKEQLKNHETTHTKSRKHKCDQCGKAFAVKSALTTHITAVHDERKTHRCDLCGKAFADSSNLSKHKQTHFRDSGGVRKSRSRRGTSTTATNSTRTSPSLSTPSLEPSTPGLPPIPQTYLPTTLMPPPTLPKLPNPSLVAATTPCPTFFSTNGPSPDSSFDPNCYCCDQQCSPPAGPASPCDDPDDCEREGFCDLPECCVQDGLRWEGEEGGVMMMAREDVESLRNYQPWGGLGSNGRDFGGS